uniref:FAM193 C-terminal domain-containing protein n=1 Tax=Tetranychus urticae TaxID=32264 RepID=T1KWZ5_TETUR
MPAVAPTSRNYNEMRERLRSRLNKRKAERGRCENRSNVSAIGNDKRKEVVGKEDNRDLEELLNYIEGTTNRDANKPGKTKKKKEKQKKKKEKQKDKKSSSSLNIMNSSVDSETSNPNQADSKTNVLKCNLSEPTSDKVNNHKDNYSNASKEDKSTQAIFDLSTPSGSHNLSPHVERTKERKHSNQIDHNSYRNTSATIASDHKVACNHSISSSNIKKTKEEKRRNGDETKSDKNQIIHTEFASTDSHEGQQATHQISQERHNHVRCSSSTPTSLVNHERSPSHCSINVSNSTNNSSTSRTTTSISKVASSTSTTLYPSRTPSSPPPLAPSIATTAKLETTSKSSLTLKNGQKFSQSSGINNASNKKPHQDRLKESIPSSDKRNCLNLATHNSPHQLIEETLSSTPKNSKRRDKRENKSRNKNISDDILSPDEVFRPKDIDLENDELDETEKEIEAFKRFCYNSVPLARKDKVNVHVNLKDILFKRSPISGNLEIKHSVKNEPGK